MKMVSAVVRVVPDTSTTMAVGSEPKGNGWETLEVQQWVVAMAIVMAEAIRME